MVIFVHKISNLEKNLLNGKSIAHQFIVAVFRDFFQNDIFKVNFNNFELKYS